MPAALRALWWAGKGDWDAAHKLAQDDDSQDGAWVHAYLHRVEGDISNARYWYGHAGKPPRSDELAAEWQAISEALISAR
nr:hypothetical protein [Variibacter gotjawalensis]